METKCPHCDAILRLKPEWSGRTVTCNKCSGRFVIPSVIRTETPHETPAQANAETPSDTKPRITSAVLLGLSALVAFLWSGWVDATVPSHETVRFIFILFGIVATGLGIVFAFTGSFGSNFYRLLRLWPVETPKDSAHASAFHKYNRSLAQLLQLSAVGHIGILWLLANAKYQPPGERGVGTPLVGLVVFGIAPFFLAPYVDRRKPVAALLSLFLFGLFSLVRVPRVVSLVVGTGGKDLVSFLFSGFGFYFCASTVIASTAAVVVALKVIEVKRNAQQGGQPERR